MIIEWVANFTPWQVYPQQQKTSSHSKGGWVGPTASLDV